MRACLFAALQVGVLLQATAALAEADGLIFKRDGHLQAVLCGDHPIACETDIWLATPAWRRVHSPRSGDFRIDDRSKTASGIEKWRHSGVVSGKRVTLEFAVDRAVNPSRLLIKVWSNADLDLEGVYAVIRLPADSFAGGTCAIIGSDGRRNTALPADTAEEPRLMSSAGHRLEARLPGQKASVLFDFPPAENVIIQDNRFWGDTAYAVLLPVHSGKLKAFRSVQSSITLRTVGTVDLAPVAMTVDAKDRNADFDGLGGNYCFQFDTPITEFTLTRLRPAWVRTEADLSYWEPGNDNRLPGVTNWPELENNLAKPELSARFELYRRLAKLQKPAVMSAWTGPEWLFETPGQGHWANNRRVPESRWPELVECIGTYLETVKKRTGLEPELFSFNEPGLGIRFKFSATELAEINRKLAADFLRRGLKTRLLLGDVASPGLFSLTETVNSFDDVGIYGAVGFHSWGGASPGDYRRWRRLADSLAVPLLVTEVGVDGADYTTPWVFDLHDYALQEAVLYADLFRHAHVNATLHWEYTPDYALVTLQNEQPVPNPTRFAQLRHFRELIPAPARHLTIEPFDSPYIRACAFIAGDDGEGGFAIHIVNTGGSRAVEVAGIPAGVANLQAIKTTADAAFEWTGGVDVRDASLSAQLPARGLLTLTTVNPGSPNK